MFPAWFDVHLDNEVARRPTALRVYAYLLRTHYPLILEQPQRVKAVAIAHGIGASRRRVLDALHLLIERGYLVVHRRGVDNVPEVTLARVRQGR